MPEEFKIIYGGSHIPVRIKRNKRARRLILRLEQGSGGVILTIPPGTEKSEAIAFTHQNAEWLHVKIQERPARQQFSNGQVLSLLDKQVRIRHDPDDRSAVRLKGNELIVCGRVEHLQRRVFDWLKVKAKDVICPRAELMAGQLGKRIGRGSVRNTRTRWGSCSSRGNLSFCWRLILTPEWVLNYVIAHEVSHLSHMNHGPAFWQTVASFDVKTDKARAWLNDNTARLQRIGP